MLIQRYYSIPDVNRGEVGGGGAELKELMEIIMKNDCYKISVLVLMYWMNSHKQFYLLSCLYENQLFNLF